MATQLPADFRVFSKQWEALVILAARRRRGVGSCPSLSAAVDALQAAQKSASDG